MSPVTAITRAVTFLNSVLFVCTVSTMPPSGRLPHAWPEDPSLDTSSCRYANINTTYNNSNTVIHTAYPESGKYHDTYIAPVYGVLIHVRSKGSNEPTACVPPLITKSTPDRTLPVSEPWIALIKRGDCEFGVKVKNAIDSNASAVLVYNNEEATALDRMSIPEAYSEYPYFGTTLTL